MCLTPPTPKPNIVESTDPRGLAAADAIAAARGKAQGYGASLLGGLNPAAAQPSIGRSLLFGQG